MTTREKLGWLLLAFCLGLALGLILARHMPPPPPRKSKAQRPMATPKNNKVIDIFEEREGLG